MMHIRTWLLAIAGFIIAAEVHAQESTVYSHVSPPAGPHAKLVKRFEKSILQSQRLLLGGSAGRPTTLQQRIIAQNADGDSSNYYYSGDNGSVYNYSAMEELLYPTYFDIYPTLPGLEVYDYSTHHVMADSIYSYYDNNLEEISYAYYGMNHRMDSAMDVSMDSGTPDYYRTSVSYDASNRIDTLVYRSANGSGGENASLTAFAYDSQNRLITDSSFDQNGATLTPTNGSFIYYGTSGKVDSIVSGGAAGETVSRLNYYPSGLLKEMKTYEVTGGLYTLTYADSFGYTAGIGYPVFYQQGYYDGPTEQMLYGYRMIKYTNAESTIDSIQTGVYDTDDWMNEARLVYYYNSYGNPDSIVATYYDDEEPYSSSARFYYEVYDDATTIADIGSSKELRIFPNPFTDKITINYSGASAGTLVNFRLTDVSGKIIFKEQSILHQGHNEICIPGVSAGNYIFILEDNNGKTWNSKVTKQ